jgi:hypothetical protein
MTLQIKSFKQTPAGKGVRTGLQTIVGLLFGLVAVVWAVPGVPEAVTHYVVENLGAIAVGLGVSSGLVSWAINKLGL